MASLYGTTGYQSPELEAYGDYKSGQVANPETPNVVVNNPPQQQQTSFPGGGSPQLSYGNNLNYQNYANSTSMPSEQGENMYTAGGRNADEAGNQAIASKNMYAMIAGGVSKAGGGILSVYGAYKDRQEAKRKYEDMMDEYYRMEAERQADKAREAERASRQEGYFASEFTQGLEDRLAGSYGGYAQGGQ